jgi:hypothetical protein
VDDVLHQDPEVARQEGYPGTTMPEGALSILAVEPDLVDLDLLRAGRLVRRWTAHAPAVADEQLTVSVEKDGAALVTTFATTDGAPVAVDRLEEAEPWSGTASGEEAGTVSGEGAGEPAFRTGPIDFSRVRALLWSVGCLRGEPAWDWGQEPPALVERALGLLLPSIVAGRAATGTARWVHRVDELTCRRTDQSFAPGARLEAWIVNPVSDSGASREVRLTSGGAVIAFASVLLGKATPPGLDFY